MLIQGAPEKYFSENSILLVGHRSETIVFSLNWWLHLSLKLLWPLIIMTGSHWCFQEGTIVNNFKTWWMHCSNVSTIYLGDVFSPPTCVLTTSASLQSLCHHTHKFFTYTQEWRYFYKWSMDSRIIEAFTPYVFIDSLINLSTTYYNSLRYFDG